MAEETQEKTISESDLTIIHSRYRNQIAQINISGGELHFVFKAEEWLLVEQSDLNDYNNRISNELILIKKPGKKLFFTYFPIVYTTQGSRRK